MNEVSKNIGYESLYPPRIVRYNSIEMNQLLNEISIGKFSVESYEHYIGSLGLKYVWKTLIDYLDNNGTEKFSKNIVNFNDIGRLYEIGLAKENKLRKKDCGKYYTPLDVSKLMAELLIEGSTIINLSDVACGCGNLIIEVLKLLKRNEKNKFNDLIKNVHLYDTDELALEICVSRLSALFNVQKEVFHVHKGDFLSKKVNLPESSFTISNPPYNQIKKINNSWDYRECINESKDLYVGFIEKIVNQSKKAIIISPQSYIVGLKFSKIRNVLYKLGTGNIYSFDNVPGTIFNGKKEGIFNSNTSNGVRSSILDFNKNNEFLGYRLTHLIRFKATEREKTMTIQYLNQQLGRKKQNLQRPLKCFVELESFVDDILQKSKNTINSLFTESITNYPLYVNSSARYFIVGSKKKLKRNGSFTLYANNEDCFYKLYALLNSSYCYLWWRMLDGGILLPKNLLSTIPVPNNIHLDTKLKSFIDDMTSKESDYLVYKKNAGVYQESIKFPTEYRNSLNNLLFKNIDFSIIHKNCEDI